MNLTRMTHCITLNEQQVKEAANSETKTLVLELSELQMNKIPTAIMLTTPKGETRFIHHSFKRDAEQEVQVIVYTAASAAAMNWQLHLLND